MFNQVSAFLTQNNLLDSNQSGFRSGHSTETALLSVVEALRLARADSKSSILILLDLSAAFDTVNHQILLSTLLSKGISGTALQWFESYLSDRSFKVSWRGEVSKSQHLTTGVYQGSVLGLLLFSVYMASLGSVIQKHGFSYHCYADDTQLYLSFHPDDPTIAARISACLTSQSVHITEDLSWTNNTAALAKKAQQRLYFLRKLRRARAPAPIMCTFYRGTIESILTSCITVWYGACNASCRKSLQRIVRAAEKIVGVSLPSLQDIYTTRLTRKALYIAGDTTHPTHSFFSLLPSGRRLRSLQARTNRLKDSFIHQAVRKLNSLPSLPPLPSLTPRTTEL